ncbi:hypothetical protein E7T06_01180 [Deinococcus sp. Arct2-2]|uniref:hypothetical protein n=1 Tax=Deinococcus sp. Arct2-2 TaxID=2568653 RepID=UPI0010A51BC5|nr:hypothetical protein [Deinococcus sp. Arct2-2]THF71999.1 hypothetical protein E7T06_01180 [Deinococcus sp. Arct2-2]
MIVWLDLLAEGDQHPRRFDSRETLLVYLTRVERLTREAAQELIQKGEIGPPLARRTYQVRALPLPSSVHT